MVVMVGGCYKAKTELEVCGGEQGKGDAAFVESSTVMKGRVAAASKKQASGRSYRATVMDKTKYGWWLIRRRWLERRRRRQRATAGMGAEMQRCRAKLRRSDCRTSGSRGSRDAATGQSIPRGATTDEMGAAKGRPCQVRPGGGRFDEDEDPGLLDRWNVTGGLCVCVCERRGVELSAREWTKNEGQRERERGERERGRREMAR